jgi:sugar lactone lactonase YvrE
MSLKRFFQWQRSSRVARPPGRTHLRLEALEDRLTPSGDYLLVTNVEKHNVLRYDAHTGDFVDEFVTRRSGDLKYAWSAVFGPDGELYVSSGHQHSKGNGTTKAVLRYDGATGAFLDEFVDQGQMLLVHAVTFGPDGNIYVGDKKVLTPGNPHQLGGRIMRFDGHTGAFMDEFVPLDSGGLKHPVAHVFGPDGQGGLDLYVSDEGPSRILRYDGATGAFIGEFVTGASGGLSVPNGVVFGPDGNLFVASFGTGSVMRFQGPSGNAPGAPLPAAGNDGANFIATGSGGLLSPTGILFGPDGNGDGHQDLYVSNLSPTGVTGKLGNVKRYDGLTGAFIDTFVSPRSGGLDDPSLMTFTRTDPVTLAYTGDLNARISIGDMTIAEGANQQTTLFTFTVTLSAAYDQPVTMSFATANGTAKTGDNDYLAKTGTLTFAPGETTKTITIEVKGDSKKESNETFYLDLFGNSGNALFTKNRGLGMIMNDD